MLLSTYVDDLTLAGQVDQRQKVWDKLTSLVDVERPELIYRVFCRKYSVVGLPWCGVAADSATSGDGASEPAKPVLHMVFDMYGFALQTVGLYISL